MTGSGRPVRVAALTGGVDVPSGRFRVEQLLPALAARGFELHMRPARYGAYPPRSLSHRARWLMQTLVSRGADAWWSRGFDLTLLQREMVSTLSTWEGFTKRPRVLDIDDAIWLRGRGRAIERIARDADCVIAGNEFIAAWARPLCSRVEIAPTAVDTGRFTPAIRDEVPDGRRLVLGWTGVSGGLPYLYGIERALWAFLERFPAAVLRVVSDVAPRFSMIPGSRVEYVPWSRAGEVESIRSLDIGLMPLVDSDWERGKCSYKMLLYMACGVAVAVSPVGMNREVLAMGTVGVACRDEGEWIAGLTTLAEDAPARRDHGAVGRRIVTDHFSIPIVAAKVADALATTARQGE